MEKNQNGMGNLMYYPLESVFESTMEREGMDVEIYTTGETFKAFFRRNDDGNNMEDRITIFYGIDAPVHQGSVIKFYDRLYILLNRETQENFCYYKSSAIQCSGVITTNSGSVDGVPTYGTDLQNGLAVSNGVLTVISGDMEFICEDEPLGRNIKIDDTFNIFGRTFKIENIYYKNGILHFITKVSYDEKETINYRIEISEIEKDSYDMEDELILTATLYRNNKMVDGEVTWISSNEDVATISTMGYVTFISSGSVQFTCRWDDAETQVTTKSIYVNEISTGYRAKIEGEWGNEIYLDWDMDFTFSLYDGEDEIPSSQCNWDYQIDFDYAFTVKRVSNNVINLICTDGYGCGEILTITVTELNTGTNGVVSMELHPALF